MFFLNPSRRHFLQTTAAALGTLILPRSLFAGDTDCYFWFIHADSLTSWQVADPAKWSLEHAHEPILERASEGLAKLTADDGERIVRLVVRRCGLNLLELHPEQVVVHHWSAQRADIRPFLKQHRLARPQVEVVLRERKKEVVTTQPGDDFLFGERLAADFSLDRFQGKWASRFMEESDNWQAAPGTWSGFAWEDVEDNRIPWAALKSVWRRAVPLLCRNCDQPTILTNFGVPWNGLFSRTPRFLHVCGLCQRSFRDEAMKDVPGWMSANLDAEVRPDYEMVWDRRMKRGMA